MSNFKVAIIGDMHTAQGRTRLEQAENMLLKNPHSIELITLRKEMTPYFKNTVQEHDWVSEYLEYCRNGIQRVDRLVLLADEPSVSLGWIIGYAWAWGKPIILIVPKPLKLGLFAVDSITATLKSIDDLKKYDFKEMPYIYEGAEVSAL